MLFSLLDLHTISRDHQPPLSLLNSRTGAEIRRLIAAGGLAGMAVLHLHLYLTALGCWLTQLSSSFLLPNATELLSPPEGAAAGPLWGAGVPRGRRRRSLSPHDMSVILEYHNQVRAQVSPPAANMEYMVSWAVARGVWSPPLWWAQGVHL